MKKTPACLSWKGKSSVVYYLSCRAVKFTSSLFGGVLARRYKVTILFATETGKSQAFASRLNDLFLHGFDAKCICMEDYKIGDMENEQCMLLVASTFGNGEAPDNGQVNYM